MTAIVSKGQNRVLKRKGYYKVNTDKRQIFLEKELTEYERVMIGIEIDIDTINKVINDYIMKEENNEIKRR